MTMLLLEWIATSIFLILVVLALRAALGKRISAGLRYALWAVVLLRLLVPVQLFASPIAGRWVLTETRTERTVADLPPAAAAPSAPAGGFSGLPETEAEPGTVPALPDPPALPDAPEPLAAPDPAKLSAWLGWVWLSGGAAAALVLLASNLRFYRRLRRGRIPMEGTDCPLRVYAAVGLPSPCLFGLVRPAVYVTPEAAADPAMLRHVLAHEYTHFRQGDHIWSLLRCGALAVHWWNPLVWLAAGLSRRDGELACDEGALRRLGDGERAGYGNTLLALVTAKPGPGDLFRCATTMAGDKKCLKERIARIAQAPRRWLWAAVAVVLATALACLCAFGQAETEKPGDLDGLLWPYGASEIVFVRDAGGFGGDFTITLRQDGGFEYYEGLLSSYIGRGTWTQEDGVICLTDKVLQDSAGIRNHYFTLEDGDLIFRAEGSAAFKYLDVEDGERFSRRADEARFSMNGDRNVLIEGLGAYVEWSRGTDGGALYLAGDLSCFCPKLADERAEGGAFWEDVGKSVLHVRLSVEDERIEDGTVNGFVIDFTVDLSSDTFTRKEFTSELGDKTIELTNQEMLDMARALARLMTAAEEWYSSYKTPVVEIAFQYTGNNPASSFAVPADVLNAAKAHVAAQFQTDVPGGVLTTWGESYNDETGVWEPVLLAKAVPFDRVRIQSMRGPDLYTVQAGGEDVEVELWKVLYEYHTTVPEFARNLLAGGMTLDDEGWMNFTGGFNYLAVTGEGKDRTVTPFLSQANLTSVGFRTDLLGALQGAGMSSGERYENAGGVGRDVDLDRDGMPERVQTCDIVMDGQAQGRRVELWEGERLLFSEEGYFIHPGYNALFLCTLDGEDYLLRYHPVMYQGMCTYNYQLFTLENGRETVIRENSLEFDINFQPQLHESFDPEAIAALMEEVNALLDNSVPLLNTDEYLADTFEKEGRLYDSLWWLDMGDEEGFARDPAKTLLENLRDYQRAMETQWYAGNPEVLDVREAGSGHLRVVRLRYQDRTADFFANWDSSLQPPEEAKPQVLDLNGDGRDEIVCIFHYTDTAGADDQELHVFDAQTLEEYDLSGLRQSVVGRYECTEYETCFYLEGPGIHNHVRIRKAGGEVEAVRVGEHVRYGVQDGGVLCWVELEMSGADLHDVRYIGVDLDFTGSGFQIREISADSLLAE